MHHANGDRIASSLVGQKQSCEKRSKTNEGAAGQRAKPLHNQCLAKSMQPQRLSNNIKKNSTPPKTIGMTVLDDPSIGTEPSQRRTQEGNYHNQLAEGSKRNQKAGHCPRSASTEWQTAGPEPVQSNLDGYPVFCAYEGALCRTKVKAKLF
jgi:hypothetical protein